METIKTRIRNTKTAINAAEKVIKIFEVAYPGDNRPQKTITAAKKWTKDPSEENYLAALFASNAASDAGSYIFNTHGDKAAYAALNATCFAAFTIHSWDSKQAAFAEELATK